LFDTATLRLLDTSPGGSGNRFEDTLDRCVVVIRRLQVDSELEPGCGDETLQRGKCGVFASGLVGRHGLLADPGP
jgi:hypothetical protein